MMLKRTVLMNVQREIVEGWAVCHAAPHRGTGGQLILLASTPVQSNRELFQEIGHIS